MLWLVRSGEGGEVVDECVANGVAAVGYSTVGDVRERTPAQVLKELMRATNRTDYETLAQRLLDFAKRMREGDYIDTSDGARRQLVIGRVNGTYQWRENSPIPGMRHLLPVEWLGRITDPTLVALGDRAAAGDLRPVTPPTRVRRARSTRTPAIQTTRSEERLCAECFLWKHVTQFEGDSTVCREHTG